MKTLNNKSFASAILLVIIAFFNLASAGNPKKVKLSLKTDTSAMDKEARKNKKDSIKTVNKENGFILADKFGAEVRFPSDSIIFVGYDKQLNATKETFHVINRSPYTLTGAKVKIVYKDMSGRMFHSRTVSFKCDIPSGETRKIDLPSWDSQKSFYYHLSTKPRRQAVEYTIELDPVSFTFPTAP